MYCANVLKWFALVPCLILSYDDDDDDDDLDSNFSCLLQH